MEVQIRTPKAWMLQAFQQCFPCINEQKVFQALVPQKPCILFTLTWNQTMKVQISRNFLSSLPSILSLSPETNRPLEFDLTFHYTYTTSVSAYHHSWHRFIVTSKYLVIYCFSISEVEEMIFPINRYSICLHQSINI